MKIVRLSTILSVLAALLLPDLASAQAFPSKPIKIVVPYPPGGASDIVTRIYAAGVGEILGQTLIVENKPGGGTNIAAESVARSAPDGYTLFMTSFASHAVNRFLFSKLPFDPVKDFTQVAMMMRGVMFACVKPDSPFKTAADIAEFGRKNPGKLTYGSTGNGSPNHISGELLKSLGKFDAVHVPYRGAGELRTELAAGQLDYAFDASIIADHRSGKLRCVGVSSAERWPAAPEIPPMAETVPGYNLVSFFGIAGPAKLPAEVVQKLNDAFVAVGKRPDTEEKLKIAGVVAFAASLKETQDFMLDVDQRWGDLVKATGAKVD